MAYYRGAITIQPKAARLTHDTAIFKMDPYCVVWLGNQSARTSTHHDGGRNPHWNDVLTLIRDQEENIRFLIYDRESLEADAFVAEGHFHFNAYQGGIFEEWIPLQYAGRSAGELNVNIQVQSGDATGHIPAASVGYQQPVQEVIVEEGGRHHHGERVKEVIYDQQPGGYPQPVYQQPAREVIIEEGRHHKGERVEEVIYTQPGQQIPGQPYPGQQVIYEQFPNQPHYRPGNQGFRT